MKLFPYLLLVSLFCLSAFSPPQSNNIRSGGNTAEKVEVFVVSNGVHTDLVLPVKAKGKDWNRMLPAEWFKATGGSYSFIAFGWGNKDFFVSTPTWSDLKFSTACKAAFGMGSSAMHVRYLGMPQISEECISINISADQYKSLVKYIEQSFCMNGDCAVLINHPGYGLHDLFFEARGKYTLFRTCNVWTNNALKNAGVKTPAWTPFADGLMHALHNK